MTLVAAAGLALSAPQQQEQPPPTPAPAPSAPAPQAPPPAQQEPGQIPQPPPRSSLNVVVLDAAHGGPDSGARGANGVIESEVVLSLAQQVRSELERQGFRVVFTRQGNENLSFDERSAIANRQRKAAFISLHVASLGAPGTARAYSVVAQDSSAPRAALLLWDHAQEPYAELSRRLAELVQVQLAQKFRGSPEAPAYAPVRQLRTVAEPAIAIEVSSVSVAQRGQLERMGAPLGEAVARALAAFRLVYEAEEK